MNILKINDVDLAYDSFGNENDEAIILIAGLGTQMIRWSDSFCQILATRGFRVIRFDNRDVGCSTHFSHYRTLDFNALVSTLNGFYHSHPLCPVPVIPPFRKLPQRSWR